MDELDVAGGAVDQRADGGPVVLPDDQVALPVPRDESFGGFGGPFADGQAGGREPGGPLVGTAPLAAVLASGPQLAGRTVQAAAVRQVDRLFATVIR
ncbi:hypothetical protein [Kitasatospora sp. NPDC017646]|uniref:hypothetical protein n=1 Tax=Kitasatospora sp. NPDC017646 TaxID=3364024 RepID=UPI003790FBD0